MKVRGYWLAAFAGMTKEMSRRHDPPCRATPSSTSPPISPSCAAAPMPRSWWRRQRRSGSRPSPSPTATRLPAWCAPISPRRRSAESNSSSAHGSISKMRRACSPIPRDRAAYGRLCRLLTLGQRRAEKGQCTLFLDDVASHAEGLIFIALPPDDWTHPSRRRFAPPQGEAQRFDLLQPSRREASEGRVSKHGLRFRIRVEAHQTGFARPALSRGEALLIAATIAPASKHSRNSHAA